jgi:hypothetical protein
MVQNPENRGDTRFNYKSPVTVEDLESSNTLNARMVNYSKNGLCFETNGLLRLGAEVHIGIENSPYTSPSFRSYESCHAKIIWRKKLETGLFNYGYGVRYVFAGDEEISQSDDSKRKKDLRKHPRQSRSIPILFATQKRFFKGLTQNISPTGAFIKTNHTLITGQALSLNIPLKGGRNAIIKGSVVWSNQMGFGVKFLNIEKNGHLQRNNNS